MEHITKFIGGPGKTNTNIIGLMVNRSDSATLINETNIIRRLFVVKAGIVKENLYNDYKTVNERCASYIKGDNWFDVYQLRRELWTFFHEDINPLEFRNSVKNLEETINKKLESYNSGSPKIVDEYFELILKIINKKNIVFKQPGIEIELSNISSLEGEVPTSWKIVYTTKNIYDIATSWFRTQMFGGEKYEDTLNRLEKRIIEGSKAVKNLPSQSVLFVSDQDLYENPSQILKNITDFLKIEYVQDAANAYKRGKRRPNEGFNDPVVSLFREKIQSVREEANKIMGTEVW